MAVKKAGECCRARALASSPPTTNANVPFRRESCQQLIEQEIIEDVQAQTISASGPDITQVGHSNCEFNERWKILFDACATLDKFKGPQSVSMLRLIALTELITRCNITWERAGD